MQSLHHLLTYVVHDIDHMLRYLLSIYLSSISISISFVFIVPSFDFVVSLIRFLEE